MTATLIVLFVVCVICGRSGLRRVHGAAAGWLQPSVQWSVPIRERALAHLPVGRPAKCIIARFGKRMHHLFLLSMQALAFSTQENVCEKGSNATCVTPPIARPELTWETWPAGELGCRLPRRALPASRRMFLSETSARRTVSARSTLLCPSDPSPCPQTPGHRGSSMLS